MCHEQSYVCAVRALRLGGVLCSLEYIACGRRTRYVLRILGSEVHPSRVLGARPYGWEYPDGDRYATLQLPGALHVNSAQTYEAAALAGLGLIQAPLLGIGRYLESGTLVEIIPDFRRRALAVSLVVAHRSNLSRRVRAFMKWIEDVLTPYLE